MAILLGYIVSPFSITVAISCAPPLSRFLLSPSLFVRVPYTNNPGRRNNYPPVCAFLQLRV